MCEEILAACTEMCWYGDTGCCYLLLQTQLREIEEERDRQADNQQTSVSVQQYNIWCSLRLLQSNTHTLFFFSTNHFHSAHGNCTMQRFAVLSPTTLATILPGDFHRQTGTIFPLLVPLLGSSSTIRDNLFSPMVEIVSDCIHNCLSLLWLWLSVESFAIYVSSINMAATGQRESLKETHHEPRDEEAQVNTIFIVLLSNLSPVVVVMFRLSEGPQTAEPDRRCRWEKGILCMWWRSEVSLHRYGKNGDKQIHTLKLFMAHGKC